MKLYSPLLAGLTAITVCAPGFASERVIVSFGELRPFTYVGNNGAPRGFAVDLFNEAARRENIDLEWRETPLAFDALDDALLHGQFDMSSSGRDTPHRREILYVSAPWWVNEVVLVVRADSGIRTVGDLRGKRIALDSSASMSLAKSFPGAELFTPDEERGSPAALEATCEAKADAAVMAHIDADSYISTRPSKCTGVNLRVIETSVGIELSVVARPEKEAIARRLRSRVDELALDGTLAAIASRYPRIPARSAIALVETTRQRYRSRLLLVASIGLASLLTLGGIFVLRSAAVQRALRASEARYRGVLENINEGFLHLDSELRVLYANAAAERDFGMGRQELIGKRPSDVFSGAGLLEARFRQVIDEQRPTVFDYEDTPRDKRYEVKVYPGESNGGVAVFYTDITERKRTQETLERMHRMVSLANHAARSGAFDWNLETGELIWTREYYTLFALDPSTAPSMDTFYSLVYPDDLEHTRKSIEDAIRGRTPEFRTEFRTVLPDGVHWIERRGQLICDENGKPLRMIGVNSDVTDRKKLEQALQESNTDLQSFVYAVSHDLQEPLRTISGFSELLVKKCRDALSPDGHELVGYIVNGTLRMQKMIHDLLEFSRAGDTTRYRSAPVDCNEIARQAIENVRQTIDETGARITVDELPVVSGTDTLILRVFQNLISNSLKYRGERPPQIHLSAEQRDGQWLFWVKDNGIGFDAKHAKGIFQIFKRLHTADQYPGTGVGLAIVKRIVERHGGSVCAESWEGKGSVFYFTLPSRGLSSQT